MSAPSASSSSAAPPRAAPAAKLAEVKPLTLIDHVFNVLRLVVKELRSIRSDPTMLILVAYAFSISVNTVATGAVTEATNLSVGIVDEDGSELSRQIAEGLVRPTFQPAVQIRASDIDQKMDRGELLFVVEIPPNFQADILAQRKTQLQINVDATAVAQAGNGANYLKTALSNEVQNFISGRVGAGSQSQPINLVVRARFNPNLKTAWFSAMTQVINQITLLTVILTGAALIREREQGTVEHLLVMPVVPAEIMLAKMFANGLVILVAAMLSLQFVVHWWIGAPIAGSIFLFLLGAALYALVVAALGILLGTLATTMGQFGLLAMPVLMVTQLLSGSSTPMESMPIWLQYVMKLISPTPHFVAFGQAVLFRGADITLVWRPLVAMLIIGAVYFAFAMTRFRRVIFGS
jgi:ABC-2 type transport system permease protein